MTHSLTRRCWWRWRSLAIAMISVCFPTASPAAEQIRLNYGPLEFSIAVEDLDTFSQTGKARGALGFLLQRFSPAQQTQIQTALRSSYQVNPVTVAQFSYTTSGEQLLQEAGQLVQTPSRQNGLYGIRAASILAADQSGGLSVMNWLRQFPTDIQINVGQVLQLQRQIASLLKDTNRAVASLEQQSAADAAAMPIDFSDRPDLRQPGTSRTSMQTLRFYDEQRDRSLTVDLYLPEPSEQTIPTVVVSNGLGARRDRFTEFAQHLTSHGFAVVVPDHPGSDRQRLQDFYRGLYQENFAAEEFIDRPLDITFLLDQLEQNQTGSQRLDLDRVGVFGYSFGGTTALSLAGATVDLATLQQDCDTQMAITNISLLYQCRALELPEAIPDLRDDRISAVYLFVPFGRSLFGQTGIRQVTVPVLWEATDEDFLTPLVLEQIPTFSWLTTSDRYLVVSKGLPHARINLDIINGLTNRKREWSQLRSITQNYHNALSVAFFKAHVAEDDTYQIYLNAAYTQALTEQPYTLSLVESVVEQP